MNHSVNIIADYVCDYYGITRDQLSSGDRHWPILKARHIILWLAGMNQDEEISEVLGITQSTIRANRITIRGYVKVGVIKDYEIRKIKSGLLKYEIS